jgi:hypothetical protein
VASKGQALRNERLRHDFELRELIHEKAAPVWEEAGRRAAADLIHQHLQAPILHPKHVRFGYAAMSVVGELHDEPIVDGVVNALLERTGQAPDRPSRNRAQPSPDCGLWDGCVFERAALESELEGRQPASELGFCIVPRVVRCSDE